MFSCLSLNIPLNDVQKDVMGLVSSICAALGLTGSGAPKALRSPELRPAARKPIPHLPPPPAPLPGIGNEIHLTPIVLSTFPDLQGTLGPLPLSKEAISEGVAPGKPGHFLIGSLHESGGLIPKQIGRSSDDLYSKLEEALGLETHFMAHIDSDARAAFIGECKLYHLFGKQIGKHPLRTFEEGWGCPKCGIFNPGP